MNLAVEQSLATWLQNLPSFDGIAIHTGQSNEEIPADQPAVIVGCENVDPVGGPYHIATAQVVIATPGHLDLDQHRGLVTALRTALASPTDLPTAFDPLHLSGVVLTSLAESQSENRWIATASLSLGIAAI
jgi:hypothetical protein